jgi:hypothetical protein
MSGQSSITQKEEEFMEIMKPGPMARVIILVQLAKRQKQNSAKRNNVSRKENQSDESGGCQIGCQYEKSPSKRRNQRLLIPLAKGINEVRAVGIEPTTLRLKVACSAAELRARVLIVSHDMNI